MNCGCAAIKIGRAIDRQWGFHIWENTECKVHNGGFMDLLENELVKKYFGYDPEHGKECACGCQGYAVAERKAKAVAVDPTAA